MSAAVAAVRDENDLQARIGQLAVRRYQLLHYHTHDSRRSTSGFPDSVFVGRTVLFRELKVTRRSRVIPAQRDWLTRLAEAGADACIWYAEDYFSGLVDQQLAAAAARPDTGPAGGGPVQPIAARVAKRLYLAAHADNPGRASLLWDAGAATVGHSSWLEQAQQLLALVADELPAGISEHHAFLAEHHLSDTGAAGVLTAVRAHLRAPAGR